MRAFSFLSAAALAVQFALADNHNCNCPDYEDKVCGGNLKTYLNACSARCDGQRVVWFDDCTMFSLFIVFCVGFVLACLCCCFCAFWGMIDISFFRGFFGMRRGYSRCEPAEPVCQTTVLPPQPMPVPQPVPVPVPMPQPRPGIPVYPGTAFAAQGTLVGKDANYDGRITRNEVGFVPTGRVVAGGTAGGCGVAPIPTPY